MYSMDCLCKFFNEATQPAGEKGAVPSIPEGESFSFEIRDGFGRRHNSSGPALVCVTAKTLAAHWYRNGRRQREDGPAVLIVDRRTGIWTREGWFHRGRLHRDDGPAVSIRDGNTAELMALYSYRQGRCTGMRRMTKKHAAEWFGLRW
jgi:hypothetical protein